MKLNSSLVILDNLFKKIPRWRHRPPTLAVHFIEDQQYHQRENLDQLRYLDQFHNVMKTLSWYWFDLLRCLIDILLCVLTLAQEFMFVFVELLLECLNLYPYWLSVKYFHSPLSRDLKKLSLVKRYIGKIRKLRNLYTDAYHGSCYLIKINVFFELMTVVQLFFREIWRKLSSPLNQGRHFLLPSFIFFMLTFHFPIF